MHQRILFLFLDGVGLGRPGADNPMSAIDLPAYYEAGGNQAWTSGAKPMRREEHVFIPVDANLGMPGLPQSGTGQATLFTGINCARIAGRHFGPFPHSTTRSVIARGNVFARLQRACAFRTTDMAFANAYPRRFFSYVRTTDRWTVTTLCCLGAGMRLHADGDLLEGRAIAANITGQGWPGDPVPTISEAEAAERLLAIAGHHRLTLFEYYLTDKAGHRRPGADAASILGSLDRFLGTLLSDRPDDLLIILTSDHGNLEDLSTRSHTRNPVPFLAMGRGAGHFAGVTSIRNVTPAIVTYLRPFRGSSV